MDADGWFFFLHRAGGDVRRNADLVNTGMIETVLAQSPLFENVYVHGVATPQTVPGEKAPSAAVAAFGCGRRTLRVGRPSLRRGMAAGRDLINRRLQEDAVARKTLFDL